MKIVVQTGIGVLALLGGVFLLYLFISQLNANTNIIFLIIALALFGVGAFLFVRVAKIENAVAQNSDSQEKINETGSKLLEKNNQMIQEWGKTNSKKDNLKAVQIAASAQQQAAKDQMSS
jgi:hypothetical protein